MNNIKTLIVLLVLLLITGSFFVYSQLRNKNTSVYKPSIVVQTQTSTAVSRGNVPDIQFTLPKGFTIHEFADSLGKARDLQFSPGGTLLVSSPDSGTIYALPDRNGDGVSDEKKVVLSGENHPHGIAFYNGKLYIADVDKVVRYTWDESSLTAQKDKDLFSLPQNFNHNNRTITFDKTGKMFVSVGSTCNVCIEKSEMSATVMTSDSEGNNLRVFAKGLRNAPFIQFNPKSGDLWGTEMGRDFLGDNTPPDEINIIKDNSNYGWPKCYGNRIHDTNFDKSSSNPCLQTVPPIFEIPAHSAPLGWTFIDSKQFPGDWQGDMLVSYHGSWNRSSPTGYKVVKMKVLGNTITSAEDFLTGFIPQSAKNGSDAMARPVDLIFDKNGNLFLSDDKSGKIFIIQKN